jgi:hypothetical protein
VHAQKDSSLSVGESWRGGGGKEGGVFIMPMGHGTRWKVGWKYRMWEGIGMGMVAMNNRERTYPATKQGLRIHCSNSTVKEVEELSGIWIKRKDWKMDLNGNIGKREIRMWKD